MTAKNDNTSTRNVIYDTLINTLAKTTDHWTGFWKMAP